MGKLHSKHGKIFNSEEKITAVVAVVVFFISVAILSSNTFIVSLLSILKAAICKPRESPEGKHFYPVSFPPLREAL